MTTAADHPVPGTAIAARALRMAPVLAVALLAVACGPAAMILASGEGIDPLGPTEAAEAAASPTVLPSATDIHVPDAPVPVTEAAPTVAAGTCDDVVYTPPTAGTARQGELCLPVDAVGTTVVLVHGGGGYEGDRSQTDSWRDVHLAAGRATFSIDYALLDPEAPGSEPLWPLPEQNVKAAVQFVRMDETLPADEIIIHGFSAGARLAGIAATTARHPAFAGDELWPDVSDAVDAAVLFYGYFDGWQFHTDAYYGGAVPEGAVAVDEIDAEDPPLLLVHGTADTLIEADHSVAMAAAADAAGARADLILVDDVWHVFDGYAQPALTEAGAQLLDEIDAHVAS